jgi:hypothetical protein
MSSVSPNNIKLLEEHLAYFNKKNNRNNYTWGDEGLRAEEEKVAAMGAEEKAAYNRRLYANNVALQALQPRSRSFPVANMSRRAQPNVARAQPKPRPGKVMRECKSSNVVHAHETSGAPCKFVHKNEPEFGMLRPDQKRSAGGKTRSKRSNTKRSNKRKSRRRGGAIVVPASPEPLSKVNTYTSWPGGVDPTAPLYNQRTML